MSADCDCGISLKKACSQSRMSYGRIGIKLGEGVATVDLLKERFRLKKEDAKGQQNEVL